MVTESSASGSPPAKVVAAPKGPAKAVVGVTKRSRKPVATVIIKPYSTTGRIELLLRGRADIGDRVSIYRLTQEGIPVSDIMQYVDSVPMFKEDNLLVKILGVSERTMHRRLKNPNEPLSPDQSARAVRFAQVLDKAMEVFGSPESAEKWMSNPAMGLDGHKPIDLLANPVGFELVDEFLTRLEYGVYQ